MEKIVILGQGGHAKSLIDVIEREKKYEIAGYIISDIEQEKKHENYSVIGRDRDIEKVFRDGIKNAAIGIGYLGKSDVRKRLWAKLKEIGFFFPTVCDPSAILARNTRIGEGCFIGKGVIINTNVTIGEMCIINTGAIIEHDCQVGNFTHVSVGSILCGGVRVGKGSFIGANATVIQERIIGDGCIIGASTAIRENVEDKSMICDGNKVKVLWGG